MSTSDHYQLLDVERNAMRRTIRAAYRKALRLHHPDAKAGNRDGEQMLLQVIAAGRILCDPEQRTIYDKQLAKDLLPRSTVKSTSKQACRLIDPQKILLSWQKILRTVNLGYKRFFTAEQARHIENLAVRKTKRSGPDFSFYLNQARKRKTLPQYQCDADGIYRKATRQSRHETQKSWQKRTALWLLVGIMLWRI